MKKSIINSLGLILAILIFTVCSVGVKAQDAPKAGFAVSPPSFDLDANAGDHLKNTIKVENLSTGKLTLNVRAENFVAYGEGGQINLTEENSSYSINSWLKFDETTFDIQPGNTFLFNFEINVPANVEPGSHYGAVVFYTAAANPDPNSASVSQEIGSIILLRTPGEVKEEASLISFKSDKDYFTEPKVKLNALIENTGSVHFKPYGVITIQDILGNKVQTIEITGKNILPDSKRLFDQEFDFDKIGIFRANLQMFYKNGEKSITADTTFISLYTQRLIPIGGGILAVIVFYLIFRKRINKAIRVIIKG